MDEILKLLIKYAVNESWSHDIIISGAGPGIAELLSSVLYSGDSGTKEAAFT